MADNQKATMATEPVLMNWSQTVCIVSFNRQVGNIEEGLIKYFKGYDNLASEI